MPTFALNFYNPAVAAIHLYHWSSTACTVTNNVVYGTDSLSDADLVGCTQTANLMNTDPLFVDVAQHDYHLLCGSPAIDHGVPLPYVPIDFDAASPIEAAVKTAYAANPIPQIPAGQFGVRGGLTYPGVGGQSTGLWNTNKTNFMPRISFAYSITSATVPPHIISRNLTPDENGIPVGGFAEFYDSLRHGIDPDHLHPNCNGTTITSNCFNPPFNGNLLQVMPWPNLQELSDHDLHAIYTYLTAVPCVVSPGHSCS
jgi:hypothetical protein